jgi:hypothetical protein
MHSVVGRGLCLSSQTHAHAPETPASRPPPAATWDTPFFFARGADRMSALSRLLALSCGRVVATPRILTVSMINEYLVRGTRLFGTIFIALLWFGGGGGRLAVN